LHISKQRQVYPVFYFVKIFMNIITFDQKFKHLKTGKIYEVYHKEVINCTNSNDNQKLVLYTNGKDIFVRDLEEFCNKFELIED